MSLPPATISYDLSNSPDRVATSLKRGTRFVCELFPGDQWTVFKGYVVIVNPDRPPRMFDVDGNAHELTFAPADAHELTFAPADEVKS